MGIDEFSLTTRTNRLTTVKCQDCGTVLDVSAREVLETIECPACGATKRIPGVLGQYELYDVLGSGGVGDVYLGRDPMLDRRVAVKVLKEDTKRDPGALERFRQEAQVAARLNHPNVAQVYAFGVEMGQPYLVMEFVEGLSLAEMITSGEKLKEWVVLRIGMDAAQALDAAAAAGLTHGDVKPENLIYDPEHGTKLIDFGMASLAPQGEVWGTPYYISPEKVLRKAHDFRSDIYSLGATLYHALAGRVPFAGDDLATVLGKKVVGDPKPLRRIRPDISHATVTLIERAMARDVGMRHPTYTSLIGDLKRAIGGLVLTGRHRTLTAHMRRTTAPSGAFRPVSGQAPTHKAAAVAVRTGHRASPAESARTPPSRGSPALAVTLALLVGVGLAVFLATKLAGQKPTYTPASATLPPPAAGLPAKPSGVPDVQLTAVAGQWKRIQLEGVATSANARRPYLEGVGKPAHGFAMIQGEIIAYVPPAGYTGSDTFEYTVHDPKAGRSATGKIVVTVEKPPPNRPPVASFTASPTTGPAPLKVDFDAGGSTDPDRDSLTYTWSFGDGSTSSPESNPTAEHTYEKDGRYTIVLTVTDGKSGSVTERKTVTVTKKK